MDSESLTGAGNPCQRISMNFISFVYSGQHQYPENQRAGKEVGRVVACYWLNPEVSGEAALNRKQNPQHQREKRLYHSLLADLDMRWCYLSQGGQNILCYPNALAHRRVSALVKDTPPHHGRKRIKWTSQKNFKSFSTSPVTANSYFSNKPFSQVATILTPSGNLKSPTRKRNQRLLEFFQVSTAYQYKLRVQLDSEGLIVSHVMKDSVETGKFDKIFMLSYHQHLGLQ